MDINKLAKKYGTPIFLIDLDKVKENFERFKRAFPNSIVAYSYKTNFHLEILRIMDEFGAFSEVISNQEIFFAEKIGVNPKKIIYDGLGRQKNDFEKAIKKNFFSINLNSIDEIKRLSSVAKRFKKIVEVGIRINPGTGIREQGFSGDSRFGVKVGELEGALEIINKNKFLKLKILSVHMGTNIIDPPYYIKVFKILDKLAQKGVSYLDLGGGFASENILKENNKSISNFGKSISKMNNGRYKLIFEPGRYIIEDACYCITKVLSINNDWVITDITGNFLIPLANANYRVIVSKGNYKYNFSGNSCFGADVIQKNVKSKRLREGKIIQINNTGAYTFSLRNNMGFPDPVILVKKNNKIMRYKDKTNPEGIFKQMISDIKQ